jgi:hypothetical protein
MLLPPRPRNSSEKEGQSQMANYQYKVANPVPMLAIVNPKGGKMATKKKASSAAKPRKSTAKKTTSSKGKSTAAARKNPTRYTSAAKTVKKTTKRRSVRNPLFSGVGGEAVNITVSTVGIGIVQPFVARLVGPLLPFGQYNTPILAAGTGWGLGWLFSKFAFTKRFAGTTQSVGIALGLTGIVAPFVSRLLNPQPAAAAQMAGWNGRGRQMNGIGVTPGVPPRLIPAAAPAAPQQRAGQGMGGVGTVPARYSR